MGTVLGVVAVVVGAAVLVLLVLAALLGLRVGRLLRRRAWIEADWRDLDAAFRQRHEIVAELLAVVARVVPSADVLGPAREAWDMATLPGAAPPTQARFERDLATAVDRVLVLVDGVPSAAADAEVRGIRAALLGADARIVTTHQAYETSVAALRRETEGPLGGVAAALAGIQVPEPYEPELPGGREATEPSPGATSESDSAPGS